MFISPLRSPFCSQTLPKCPRTESSSVLKRPSDSDSALFSVTPRDRLVYASGTVRSTASNNAPYIDRVRQRERERHSHTHIHIRTDTQATWTHMHRNSDETQRDTKLGGNAFISSHFPVKPHKRTYMGTHTEFSNKVHKGVFVLFC